MKRDILHDQVHRAKGRATKTLTTAELQRILERWNDGGGVTTAVQALADARPVAERAVWYWLAARKIHRTMAERIRSLKPREKR